MRKKKADELRPIENGRTYALPTFMSDSGMGRHAMKQARILGLKVVKLSGRIYVRGQDFNDFLGKLAGDESEAV